MLFDCEKTIKDEGILRIEEEIEEMRALLNTMVEDEKQLSGLHILRVSQKLDRLIDIYYHEKTKETYTT